MTFPTRRPLIDSGFGPVVCVQEAPFEAEVLLICEHAADAVPSALNGLGVSAQVLASHVGWDPGALGVAQGLARAIAAPLVHGCVSRLVYDCNWPPRAEDAIPVQSEVYNIPGNRGLSAQAREARVAEVYSPFKEAIAKTISARRTALRLLASVHSFTPRYQGVSRDVEIGILHGRDAGFAKEMLRLKPSNFPYLTLLNAPYSAADGVAHTLDLHGAANGLSSVMLEIRNDLIATLSDQEAMAQELAPWLLGTLAAFKNGVAA